MPDWTLPEQFRAFAESAERDGGDTYAAICRGVAGDAVVLALMRESPPAQRRPNLLLAAVHFLLLGGADHPLSAYYDTMSPRQGDSPRPGGHGVAAVFADFCRSHHDALLPLMATRSTQTNEVGRCAGLLPALCHVAAGVEEDQPLSLLDLGASAGLNLLFDDYAYTYRQRTDGSVLHAGRLESDVAIAATVRSDLSGLPGLNVPAVAERVGLDLSPLDPTSEDATRWLEACLWPDNLPRFNRLRAAVAVARTATHPPRLERGDLVEDLARVAGTIDPGGPLVVLHTWVAAYLTVERQRELVQAVRALARSRPVHHLYAESPHEVIGLGAPPSPEPARRSDYVTALVHTGPDGAYPVRLADMHPHGKWIRWWPTPGAPTGRRAGPGPGPRPR
ncbi:MAG TPA: DUF2332 domain-containing protein [Acidimicrobiales bacterium]|nr:DUF2332 domain-containing protein [Acidimicrobiales bacterium]